MDLLEEDPDEDNVAEFDLTENEPRMLGPEDPFEFVFTYFTSEADAQDNSNAINNPEVYINISDPQTIYGASNHLYSSARLPFFSSIFVPRPAWEQGRTKLMNLRYIPIRQVIA